MAVLGEGALPSGNGVLPCFQPTYGSLCLEQCIHLLPPSSSPLLFYLQQ